MASRPYQIPSVVKIDFNTGAEVVVAHYVNGAMLTLVEYPTPQMASAQLAIFAKSLNLTEQPDGMLTGDNLAAGRSGVLVALVSGVPAAQGKKLAQQVHYDMQVTENDPHGYVSDAWRAAHLYLGIFALAGILCAASVILGLFFGGARAISRVLRGKSASSVEDIEFISLDPRHRRRAAANGDRAPAKPGEVTLFQCTRQGKRLKKRVLSISLTV